MVTGSFLSGRAVRFAVRFWAPVEPQRPVAQRSAPRLATALHHPLPLSTTRVARGVYAVAVTSTITIILAVVVLAVGLLAIRVHGITVRLRYGPLSQIADRPAQR
jgi:hypothetical protein